MKSTRWSCVQSAVLVVVGFLLVSSVDWIVASSIAGTRGSGGHNDNQIEPHRKNESNNAIRALHHLNNLKERRHCASFDDNVKEVHDHLQGELLPEAEPLHADLPPGGVSVEDDTAEMVCGKDSQFCYALWKYDENGERHFMKQGCWEASSTTSCKSSLCIAKSAKQTTTTTTTTGAPSVPGEGGETTINPASASSSAEGKNVEAQQHVMQQQQHFFCCCDSDNCNIDVDIVYVENSWSDEDSGEDLGLGDGEGGESGKRSFQIILILCASILCGLLIIFVGHQYWKRMALQYNKNGAGGSGVEGDGGEDGLSTLGGAGEGKLLLLGGEEEGVAGDDRNIVDGIQLVVLLARGKFASIYEGRISSLSDEPYALKCFTKDQKEFFENERFVFNYLGKHCNHENIIKYYGWQDFEVGPTTHLILVLDKICPGNLREYLQQVTSITQAENEANNENETNYLKIADVLRICSGIASGLSYLHGENRDEIVIAHRDLTSKNILIDGETLIPKITDFGLSLVTRGSKYYWAGRERQAEFCSLAEAGTLRYMAPELLEGAVNLKDCENALKQADVYALALITWEVANCSKDVRLTKPPPQTPGGTEGVMNPTTPAPATTQEETGNNANLYCVQHGLPYEDEIGKENLSMDLLSRHVVQYRNRPNFRRWRDSPYTRALRDTLVESWDAEPDARLTALCIVERLLDIRNIRVKNSDLPGPGTGQQQSQVQTPLESPGQCGLFGSDSGIIDSPWTGRNPCLQRNLLTVTATSTTSGGGSGMGMGGMSTSGSGMSDSNSLLLENHPHHPLLLNHFDFSKNQANLNFYHNYVGGSSGGASYSSTSTTSAGMGGGGGNTTEMSNVSSLPDDHHNPIIETRFHQNAQQVGQGGAPTPSSSSSGPAPAGPPPLPPTIPFVQNLHA